MSSDSAWQRQRAERATAALDAMTVNAYPRDSREWNESVILAAMEWAHQEALRDVLTDLDSLHWKDHWYADQLRRKVNDRLAREGVQ